MSCSPLASPILVTCYLSVCEGLDNGRMPTYVRTHCEQCSYKRAPVEVKDDGQAEAWQHHQADQHERKFPDHIVRVRHDELSPQLAEHYVREAYF